MCLISLIGKVVDIAFPDDPFFDEKSEGIINEETDGVCD